jgi:hypothetical protein
VHNAEENVPHRGIAVSERKAQSFKRARSRSSGGMVNHRTHEYCAADGKGIADQHEPSMLRQSEFVGCSIEYHRCHDDYDGKACRK